MLPGAQLFQSELVILPCKCTGQPSPSQGAYDPHVTSVPASGVPEFIHDTKSLLKARPQLGEKSPEAPGGAPAGDGRQDKAPRGSPI